MILIAKIPARTMFSIEYYCIFVFIYFKDFKINHLKS